MKLTSVDVDVTGILFEKQTQACLQYILNIYRRNLPISAGANPYMLRSYSEHIVSISVFIPINIHIVINDRNHSAGKLTISNHPSFLLQSYSRKQ